MNKTNVTLIAYLFLTAPVFFISPILGVGVLWCLGALILACVIGDWLGKPSKVKNFQKGDIKYGRKNM